MGECISCLDQEKEIVIQPASQQIKEESRKNIYNIKIK